RVCGLRGSNPDVSDLGAHVVGAVDRAGREALLSLLRRSRRGRVRQHHRGLNALALELTDDVDVDLAPALHLVAPRIGDGLCDPGTPVLPFQGREPRFGALGVYEFEEAALRLLASSASSGRSRGWSRQCNRSGLIRPARHGETGEDVLRASVLSTQLHPN